MKTESSNLIVVINKKRFTMFLLRKFKNLIKFFFFFVKLYNSYVFSSTIVKVAEQRRKSHRIINPAMWGIIEQLNW